MVIPHHRRSDLLARALDSLAGEGVAGEDIVVVDDSTDGDLALADAHVVRGGGGEGFARAANRGLAAAQAGGATHALLLNDDAVLQHGCLAALAAGWSADTGAVGPVLLAADGSVESAGFRIARWGRVRAHQSVPDRDTVVDGLSGACMLVSASERFDVGYAHGMEDLDLCVRVRRRGLLCRVAPAARCDHSGGATLDRTAPRAQRHAVSGHLRLVGGGLRTPAVLGLAGAQIVREKGNLDRYRAALSGWRDWRRR